MLHFLAVDLRPDAPRATRRELLEPGRVDVRRCRDILEQAHGQLGGCGLGHRGKLSKAGLAQRAHARAMTCGISIGRADSRGLKFPGVLRERLKSLSCEP